MNDASPDLTRLLQQAQEQVPGARDAFLRQVFADLNRVARGALLRMAPGQTLDTGALVNEAYLRLFREEQRHFENRHHFFATAAKAMRQILIDHARKRISQSRGGPRVQVTLEPEVMGEIASEIEDLLQLEQVLKRLARLDPRMERIAELRVFAGADVAEIAELLCISEATVRRDLRALRAMLGGVERHPAQP